MGKKKMEGFERRKNTKTNVQEGNLNVIQEVTGG